MDEHKNKIYATLDKNNIVINLFSSVFQQPKGTDILIEEGNEDYHAHVHLKYKLMDMQGRYNYKHDNKLFELTEEEKEVLFPPLQPQPTESELLKKQLLETQAILAEMQYNALLNNK